MHEYVHSFADIMHIPVMRNFQYLYDYNFRFHIRYFFFFSLTYILSYGKVILFLNSIKTFLLLCTSRGIAIMDLEQAHILSHD